MVSKLVFKGEKPAKKRLSKGGINKSSSLESSLKRKTRDSVRETVDVEDSTWTCARSVNQLTGPIVLVGVSLKDYIL